MEFYVKLVQQDVSGWPQWGSEDTTQQSESYCYGSQYSDYLPAQEDYDSVISYHEQFYGSDRAPRHVQPLQVVNEPTSILDAPDLPQIARILCHVQETTDIPADTLEDDDEDISGDPAPGDLGTPADEEDVDVYMGSTSGLGSLPEHTPPAHLTNLSLEEIDNLQVEPHYRNTSHAEEELCVGDIFHSKAEAKRHLQSWCLQNNRSYKSPTSNPDTLIAVCTFRGDKKGEGCQWRARFHRKSGHSMFELTKLHAEHTCVNPRATLDPINLTSSHIAEIIIPSIVKKPGMEVVLIRTHIQSVKNGLFPSYKKAWCAKQIAIAHVYGNWEEAYMLLPRWFEALRVTNPGSMYTMKTKPYMGKNQVVDPSRFVLDKVFWCFGPCIEAFTKTRPVIFIDGTFLYGKYHGVLLIASTCDGSNHIIPLAFAIVEKENIDSWSWFLQLLHRQVIRGREGVTIISDRHAGIVSAMSHSRWEGHYWRYCLRHLKSNYRSKVRRDSLAKALNTASKLLVTNYDVCYRIYSKVYEHIFSSFVVHQWEVPQRDKYLERLYQYDQVHAEIFINSLGHESRWSLASDGGARWGHTTTNIAESINGAFKGIRNLPILGLVQGTFYRTVQYFMDRRKGYNAQLQNAVFMGKKMLEKVLPPLERDSRKYHVRVISRNLETFSVQRSRLTGLGAALDVYRVDLKNRTCDCHMFQGLRIPCAHAIAACESEHIAYHAYIDAYYRNETSLDAYDGEFVPIMDQMYWPPPKQSLVADPLMERGRGRPRSTRIPNDMDMEYDNAQKAHKRSQVCTRCRQPGHNIRSCTQPSTNPG